MNNEGVREKAVFVVGLLASVLAFSTFKSELSSFDVNIFVFDASLLDLMLVFISLLSLSVYFYALDYLRYSLGRYQNFFILKAIIPIANMFYSFAMLFPVFLFILIVLSSETLMNFVKNGEVLLFITNIIVAFLGFSLGMFNTYSLLKKRELDISNLFEIQKTISLDRATKLKSEGFNGEALIEIQRTLEYFFKEILFEKKGLETERMPFTKILDLIIQNKFLDKKYESELKSLSYARNSAAHSNVEHSAETADKYFKLAKEILKKNTEDSI